MIKRYITAALGLIATCYTVWYMHYGVPYKNSGALSKIGLEHYAAFVIWGVLTYTVLAVGIVLAYRRYTSTKAYIPLLALSLAGMVMTLAFPFDYDIKPDYYLHCTGSLVFSAATGITVFLLFVLCRNEGRMFRVFAIITGMILAADLVLLLIFKETGLIESLPIFAGYVMLGFTNMRREKIELTR